MARKDIHRPSVLDPKNYKFLFAFSYPSTNRPGYNTALIAAVRTGEPQQQATYGVSPVGGIVITGYTTVTSPWGKLAFFEKEGAGGCDVCGAHYIHGCAFLHTPSNEVLLLGHICADKMGLVSDKGDWTRHQREMARLRKSAEYIAAKLERQGKIKAEAVSFLQQHEGLEEALKTDHHISRDLSNKLWLWGSLSTAQVTLANKLHREATTPKTEDIPQIKPPAGRGEILGRIKSCRWQESNFGAALKMLVECRTEKGEKYRLWGTVPNDIRMQVQSGPAKIESKLIGRMVKFTATVLPREKGFGIFSHPTHGEIVEAA